MSSYSIFCRLLAVLVLSIFAVSAVAGENPKGRPFKGTLYGEATWMPDADCVEAELRTIAITEGDLSHLGFTLYESDHCTSMVGEGMGRLVAANGDELYFSYVTPTILFGDIIIQQGIFLFDGGTGRFEGASGQVLGTVYVTNEGMADPAWPLEIVFAGTLVY
jgi:hypothetical protein